MFTTRPLSAIAISYLLCLPAMSYAHWSDVGISLGNEPGNPIHFEAAPDGLGGAIVVWESFSGGNRDIYAQRVNALGVVQWTAGGLPICTATGLQTVARVVNDGSGGMIAVWMDQRSTPTRVYAQRVNAAGVVQWAVDGIPVSPGANGGGFPAVAADGAGGAIVAFTYLGGIFAQRIDPFGNPQWDPAGVLICNAVGVQSEPEAISDGAGGAFIAWGDLRSDPTPAPPLDPEFVDVYAQRVDASGVLQWTPVDGVPVCTSPDYQQAYRIIADELGGTIIAWADPNLAQNIFAQRLSGSGAAQWTANGVALATSPPIANFPRLVADGSGGAIITWEEEHPGVNYHIRAQRVDVSGSKSWGPDGVGVYTAGGGGGFPNIARDGRGGVIITWAVLGDIYAQRLDSAGAPIWGSGAVVCGLASGVQPAIVEDPSGRAIVIWRDNRVSPAFDLFASTAPRTRVVTNTNDLGPGSLRDAITFYNSISQPFVVNFDMGAPGPHTITCITALDAIAVPVIIDGYSHPGSAPSTNPPGMPFNGVIQIELGSLQFTPSGLVLAGGHSVLRGLAVNKFNGGITIVSDDNVVTGNLIGLDPTGTINKGNISYGLWVLGADNKVEGNVISGNDYGVVLEDLVDGAVTGNRVIGNLIGTDANGQNAIGNYLAGISLVEVSNNAVGGSTPEERNIIAHSGERGVFVIGGDGNRISGNSIYSNGLLGIDLWTMTGPDVTPNDAGDADTGSNTLLNFPVIESAAVAGGALTVNGTYSGAAGLDLELQFFANPSCDGSGHGEGKDYLGATSINTGGGTVPFSAVLPVVVQLGTFITATATDALGNTSEFCACAPAVNTPAGTNVTVDVESGGVNASLTFDNVTAPGNTTLEVAAGCPGLPGSFIIPSAICYTLTTTAVFSGNVDVCFSYDDTIIPGDESNVRLVHYDTTLMPPQWVDITTSVDTAANIVCGEATSLSPFAIGVGSLTAIDPDRPLPTQFALHQNVPNPFNPATTLTYDVPLGGGEVSIQIYDVAGRHVQTLVDEAKPAGRHVARWMGDDAKGNRVASGVYFYRMQAGAFTATRKMVLLK